MKNILFLFILGLSISSFAQVVLIPEKNVPLQDYLSKCRLEGYQCAQDYFKLQITNEDSKEFDHFLENIDLYNEDYRRSSYLRMKNILSTENISTEQAELLLKVIKKQESIEKNQPLLEIKNEIADLLTELSQMSDEKSDAEIYLLFKRSLSKKQFTKIKYKIKYTQVIRITPYTEPTTTENLNPRYLLSGTCDSSIASPLIEASPALRYQPLFQDSCSSVALSETKTDWISYQKPLVYTLAAAAAVFLLSSYELQIQY